MTLAIMLALAFWAPYHGGPVCGNVPQGVHITYQDWPLDKAGWADIDRDNCNIQLATWVKRVPVAEQCAYVAHELGHSVMGLWHTTDPTNIMYPYPPIPSACKPRIGKARY